MTTARQILAGAAAIALVGGVPIGAFAEPSAHRQNSARAEIECRPGSRCYQRLIEEQDVSQRAYREARRAARDIRRTARDFPANQADVNDAVPLFRRGERFRIN